MSLVKLTSALHHEALYWLGRRYLVMVMVMMQPGEGEGGGGGGPRVRGGGAGAGRWGSLMC